MEQELLDQKGKALGHLAGPWWWQDDPVDPEQEHAPEEALFRIEFFSPKSTKLRLAANNFYQFWLNGRWMGNGPVRSSHGRLTVDEWDLPPTLLHEQNTIAVQVFWEGIFTFDHVRGTPGLWFSLKSESESEERTSEILVTNRTGRLPSIRSSHQRGWVEEIDARERTRGWPEGPWEPADWQKPVPRNSDPAVILEARDIRPFTQTPRHAPSITFVGSADPKKRTKHRGMYYANAAGFEDSPNSPASVMQEEALMPAQAADLNASALTVNGSGVAVIGPDASGLDRTLQLDFGEHVTGTLSLTLEAAAGTVIDFGWSEGRWNETDMSIWGRSAQPGGSAPAQELNDARQGMRYICAGGGVETFHSLFLVSLQHLRIAFRNPDPAASIHLQDLTVCARGYPIAAEGSFTCSHAGLNHLYAAARRTMACSIDDVYLDCPGRERGGYPNDSYWASLGFLETTGDFAFDQRYLRQFFASQDALGGAIAPVYPSDSTRWLGWASQPRTYIITGHILFWLIQCERHLRLSGNAELKKEWKPHLVKALAALEQYRTAEGLLENQPWDTFYDWSEFQGGPIQTGDNFMYAFTLLQLGRCYEEENWIAQGHETAAAIERLAWSPERELYADTVVRQAETLTPSSAFSATMNYLALWTGLTQPERAARVWRQLRDFRPLTISHAPFTYETRFTRAGLFGLLYRFDLQGRRGERRELIRDLLEAYTPMFERGQTTLGEHLGYQGSLCHGYNAFVIHLLNRHLAGIELPEQPGGVIRVRPHPDVLSFCQARVCWMGGYVQVWWSRTGDEVEVMASLPAGQKGELVMSSGPPLAFAETLHTTLPYQP